MTVVPAPTAVPPAVQVVGAVAWGPKTLKVMVPLTAGLVVPPASTELMLAAVMAVPAVPVPGAPSSPSARTWPPRSRTCAAPQVEVAVLLLASPP